MPMPVRLIAIQPTERKGSYTEVDMEVDAPHIKDLVQFAERLELDNEFSNPEIISQHRERSRHGVAPGVAMEIVARYRPLPQNAAIPAGSRAGEGLGMAGSRSRKGRSLASAAVRGVVHER